MESIHRQQTPLRDTRHLHVPGSGALRLSISSNSGKYWASSVLAREPPSSERSFRFSSWLEATAFLRIAALALASMILICSYCGLPLGDAIGVDVDEVNVDVSGWGRTVAGAGGLNFGTRLLKGICNCGMSSLGFDSRRLLKMWSLSEMVEALRRLEGRLLPASRDWVRRGGACG